MRTIIKKGQGLSRRALLTTLVLALLGAVLLAGTAQALTRLASPIGKAPKGTIHPSPADVRLGQSAPCHQVRSACLRGQHTSAGEDRHRPALMEEQQSAAY